MIGSYWDYTGTILGVLACDKDHTGGYWAHTGDEREQLGSHFGLLGATEKNWDHAASKLEELGMTGCRLETTGTYWA